MKPNSYNSFDDSVEDNLSDILLKKSDINNIDNYGHIGLTAKEKNILNVMKDNNISCFYKLC